MWFYEREGVIVRDAILNFNPGQPDVFWTGAGDPPMPLYCNAGNGGWNLVPWVDQTMPTVAQAVAPLGDAFVAIWHRDNQTGAWTAYKAGAPDFANNLERLVPYEVYHVQVTGDIIWNQGA
jgi:hypothetical protein